MQTGSRAWTPRGPGGIEVVLQRFLQRVFQNALAKTQRRAT